MQMIAALTESNKTTNERMERQMEMITNLQQTVADMAIRASDRDSDASTITSNEQRKRRIPHHASKSSIRRLHLSNAGTAGPVNLPPDPGEHNRYIEFPTLECQDEETPMQQDETNDSKHSRDDSSAAMTPTYQRTVETTENDTSQNDQAMQGNDHHTDETHLHDVNGGIDDDDLLALMGQEVHAMHTTPDDSSPHGPYGSSDEQC